MKWFENIGESTSMSNVKFVGSYDDHAGHTVYVQYNTPSMDNVMGMMMEPVAAGALALCTGRPFPVFDHDQVLQSIKQ